MHPNTASQHPVIGPAAILGAILLSAGAFAGVKNVPGDYPTIQAAIDDSSNGDEIVLADGTYTGAGNQDLTPAGRAITIRSANGAAGCTIDVADGSTGFVVDSGETALTRIEGITITTSGAQARGLVCTSSSPSIVDCVFTDLTTTSGGAAVLITDGNPVFDTCAFDGCTASDDGGAIHVDGGSVTVDACAFLGNVGDGGGAIFAEGGDVFVNGGSFTNNSADPGLFGYAGGGAIYVRNGNFEIDGGVFDGNRTIGETGGGGAVRVLLGSLSIDGTQFTANRCEGRPDGEGAEASGGAVNVYGSPATITNSQFDDNVVDLGPGVFMATYARGGAVAVDGSSSDPSTLDLRDCAFTTNEVRPNSGEPSGYHGIGGAIYTGFGVTLDVRDCAFEANACVSIDNNNRLYGGAIHGGGTTTIVHCDFRGNNVRGVGTVFAPYSATPGGGAISVRQSAAARLVSCTLTNNTVGGTGAAHGGAIRVLGEIDLVNCLLAGNTANGTGGAIFVGGGGSGAGPATLTAGSSTIVGTSDPDGAIHAQAAATVAMRNAIVRSDQPNAIVGAGTLDVAYSNVTGGAVGLGNLDVDPIFADATNGDYRLASGSPSIDTGADAALPADDLDLDDDGDTSEPLPVDLDDAPRVLGRAVDMGAYETDDTCAADLDGNGAVGFSDLTMLLASWGACPGCPADLDGDDSVGFSDLTALLAAWGACP